MMTYHSSSAVDRIRKLLLNYDLEIERVKSEIELRKEKMAFNSSSSNRVALRQFTKAKIEKENYEVFLNRLQTQKSNLMNRLLAVAKKYEGNYSNIFSMFFFEQKTYAEIEKETGLSQDKICMIVSRMQKDIIEFKL